MIAWVAFLERLLGPLTFDDIPETIQQSFIFVVREFAGIEEHAVFLTAFIPDVGLLGIGKFLHDVPAPGTLHIFDLVI